MLRQSHHLRNLSRKGFQANAENLVRHCQGYQFFARQAHVPMDNLICIPPSWAFSCLWLGMVGPLTKAPGGFEYIFVAIDKFTKWIEYKPLVKFSSAKAIEFLQDIMQRFGMPNRIITNLGSSLTITEFKSWRQDCGIGIDYASATHLRANGLLL